MDRRQCIFCIANISSQVQELALSDINLTDTQTWVDLLGSMQVASRNEVVLLQPYQCLWLTNMANYTPLQ